jgi:hypothetical protein
MFASLAAAIVSWTASGRPASFGWSYPVGCEAGIEAKLFACVSALRALRADWQRRFAAKEQDACAAIFA